jgi:hypothetical protein
MPAKKIRMTTFKKVAKQGFINVMIDGMKIQVK